ILAGAVLSDATLTPLSLALLLLALSLFYVAGMYLNDAFDREFDTVAYPRRPIPSGAVLARTVFTIGFLGLATGELLLIALGYGVADGHGWPPAFAGLCLAATIVYYNLRHKNNPYGPLLMGLCRVQVYLTTALALAPALPERVWWGAGLLFIYIIGLSYIARQETLARLTSLWPLVFLAAPFFYGMQGALRSIIPALIYVGFFMWVLHAVMRLARRTQFDVREGVSILIAGIALLDALLIALAGEPWLAVAAAGGCLLTRLAHRLIPGT
ncbi:MAG TPA: UbiA family prenyltransferase, partial [Nitrospiraceae bacterium]|nr:UbiA family prenyltransferase [Nitrospiraceae bacterium]